MKGLIYQRDSRHNFLVKSGILIGTTGLSERPVYRPCGKETKAAKVTPAEDLMREHGILRAY